VPGRSPDRGPTTAPPPASAINDTICSSDHITVRSDPTTLTSVWMGDVDLIAALRNRTIELDGPRHLVRTFPRWFGLHPISAGVERPESRPRVAAPTP
jgi:hypothetical protein